MTPRVAVIGLGAMGAPIAHRLREAGLLAAVWNRDPAKSAAFARHGVKVAAVPAQAAGHADIALSVLFDDAAVEAVTLADDGIAAGLRAGAIHLSCSTISPGLADRLETAHEARGQHLASAPLLGSAAMAADGTLYLAVSGTAAAVAPLEPVLAAMAQKTMTVGARPRDAVVTKLANNFLIFALTQAIAEAQALAEKSGLSREALMEMLWETDFARRVFKVYGGRVLERNFLPATAPARLAVKDIELALAAAAETGAVLPTAELGRDRLRQVVRSGWGELEFAALSLLVDRESGLAVDDL
ncbi:NAD(P)-dependent oxidoreductase [Aquamicrobium sp. LC103]|uniref:NAD(P)-dependent oxidoreductase n=1 Tax=Aquamicrobium sp. LC103 TaxID=1120658 RepID=UPI00063EAE49|nr:NAD(P)-dependent oxidoreductase [Aquamicrobium sp. LC103]TKT82485.1 NAD(P)-dependent oxidoreductase [Aquamicrobium sp. LC103]